MISGAAVLVALAILETENAADENMDVKFTVRQSTAAVLLHVIWMNVTH